MHNNHMESNDGKTQITWNSMIKMIKIIKKIKTIKKVKTIQIIWNLIIEND